MEITFYVDWTAEEIYMEEEAKQVVRENVNMETFFEWLDNNFSAEDIFQMNDDKKIDVYNDWEAEQTKSFFNDYFSQYIYDTDIKELIRK